MNKKINTFILNLLGKEHEGWKNTGFLIFRLAIGFFMLTHGLKKLSDFETLKNTFADPIGLGSEFSLILIIFAEFGCSVLIILGIFTRLAVIPLMIGMLVATFITHSGDSFSDKELPLLYLCSYIFLGLTGAGKFSVDYLLTRWWTKNNISHFN